MNLDELRAWVSANFWKSEQVVAWAERTFYRRKVHKQTRTGTGDAGQPIILNGTGYVDPSFVNSTDHAEYIADIVGAMVTGNTETGVSVTYQDADNTLDFDAQTAGDLRYAPIAKGVTNGDSHDHSGGDGAQIDHGGLAGLGDDDHSGYARLSGRSGGQTFYGGTASGNTLALYTTSNATKGIMNLADVLYVDEVNDRVGIGTNSPESPIHLQGATTVVSKYRSSGAVGAGRSIFQLLRGASGAENGWDFGSNLSLANDELTIRELTSGSAVTRLTMAKGGAITVTDVITATGINVGEDTITRYNDIAPFTPTVSAATPPSSVTYTTQQGSFERLNNKITFHARIEWSAKTGGSSAMYIPLPATAYSDGPQIIAGWIQSAGPVAFLIGTSGTVAIPYFGTSAVNITASDDVRIGGSYFVA